MDPSLRNRDVVVSREFKPTVLEAVRHFPFRQGSISIVFLS